MRSGLYFPSDFVPSVPLIPQNVHATAEKLLEQICQSSDIAFMKILLSAVPGAAAAAAPGRLQRPCISLHDTPAGAALTSALGVDEQALP